MGTSTKGVVVTKVKDLQLIGYLLQRAFNQLVTHAKKTDFPDRPGFFSPAARILYSYPSLSLNHEADTLSVEFTFRGEPRTVRVFLYVDCDHKKLGKHSLTISMGHYGKSVDFVKLALYALSPLGPTYIDESDSDDEGLVPCEEVVKNVGELFRDGLMTAYEFENRIQRNSEGIAISIISADFDKSLSSKDLEFVRENDAHEFPHLEENKWTVARWDRLEAYFQKKHRVAASSPSPVIFWEASAFGDISETAKAELDALGVVVPAHAEAVPA